MIRLVIGLCLLFLGLGVATALVVHAVRRKRAAAKLRRPFQTRTHAGTESTYWATKTAPDVTKAVTKTSGRLPEPAIGEVLGKSWTEFTSGSMVPVGEALQAWTVDYVRPKSISVDFDEWKPTHPLGLPVIAANGTWYAFPPEAHVQRYSRALLGWVREESESALNDAYIALWNSQGGRA